MSASTPEKPPHGESLGWWRASHFDFVTSSVPLPSDGPSRKPPTAGSQSGYAGVYTRSRLRVMLAENSLRRRNTRWTGPTPTLSNMSTFATPRTPPLRGWHIYPVVGAHLELPSSTSTTLLHSTPGQQQLHQRVSSPLTASSADHPVSH